jgi:tubulin-specific chaperone D
LTYATNVVTGNHKIESRVDAMQALGTMLASMSTRMDAHMAAQTCKVLFHGLTDYTNDQRGDIGSTLRIQTLDSLECLCRPGCSVDLRQAIDTTLIPTVAKLAVEKLNNVRFRAWKCLGIWLCIDRTVVLSKSTFEFVTDVCSEAYYDQLMPLLEQPRLQRHLILGLVTSSTSGSEDLCRAANTALVHYLERLSEDERNKLTTAISSIVVEELASNPANEDRAVIPLLDFLCFLADHHLLQAEVTTSASPDATYDLWTIVQSTHAPSSSIQRVEACLNMYVRLLGMPTYRARALDRMTRQLLHRWPKIRNAAAEALFTHDANDQLATIDWNQPVAKVKPSVLVIRKELGAISMAATANGQGQ